jgi:hypothetical protein
MPNVTSKTNSNKANTALKAEHMYFCGNSGTGKSSKIKEMLKKAPRAIIFDPDDEYSELTGVVRVTNANNLIQCLKQKKSANLKIAYVAEGVKAFEFWANCAFQWQNCIAVAEEIADVTTASKAPPAWGRLIRRGRKYGILICAVTQRPAEADKTILSNAAIIRTGALGRHADREAIAREMDCPVSHISKLIPLDFIEYKRSDLSLKKGRLGEKREENLRQEPKEKTVLEA